MKYVVQIFSGSWRHSNYALDDIIERLTTIEGMIPVESVIIGWNIDKALYCGLGQWLKKRNIKMFLWLPVLSEVGELEECKPVVDLEGEEVTIESYQSDETFEFYCPSEKSNWQACINVYEEYFADCGFDGVFLDKIRTQTATAGFRALFSCGCNTCREKYAGLGVDLEKVQKFLAEEGQQALSVTAFDQRQGVTFKNSLMTDYYNAKCDIVAEGVNYLGDYFKARDLEVGLDLFYPLISELVGQKYSIIAKKADFIKPMLYRRTQAPAGIDFEYRCLRDCIPEATGYGELVMDTQLLRDQIEASKQAGCRLYPGIEINYREDVARTDEGYVSESMQTLQDADAQGAVLAWDVMLAPDRHIECIAKLGRKP